jgi:cellulose synthase operon protein C
VEDTPEVPNAGSLTSSAANAGQAGTVAPVGVGGFSDLQWPPPTDWQKFERLCHAIWRRVWDDPSASMHGRQGQQQQGVDVFGMPRGSSRYRGVQCKRKDELLRTLLTNDEVRAEVESAKSFTPPLEELIIATCAPNDTHLQALARQITAEHAAKNLFRVSILGWTEIVSRIADYSDIIAEFYPGYYASSTGGETSAPQSLQIQQETRSSQLRMEQRLEQLAVSVADGPSHAKLDMCRQLLESYSYRVALQLLEHIYQQEWATASASIRFRIATNMGAAHLGLGSYEKAGDWFVKAFEFDSTGDRAFGNRALGLFLLERRADAMTAAREGIETHPLSGRTWAAFYNVLSRVDPQSPIPEPPGTLSEDPDVLLVRADALAIRGRYEDAEAVLRKLTALPRFDVMAKSRLADVLLFRPTGGHFFGGISYSPNDLAKLNEAGALLEETWEALKATDRAQGIIHVLSNWCGLSASLGKSWHLIEGKVDEGLAIAPDEPALLALKIRLAAIRGDGSMALRILEKLPPSAVDDYPIIAAGAYRAAKEPTRALEILEKFIRGSGELALAVEARCLFADLLAEADIAHAEVRFDALPLAGDASVHAGGRASRVRPSLSNARS